MLMMGYVTQLYEPLKTMGKNSAALQSYLAHIERAFALLDELPEVQEKTNPRSLVRATGKIADRKSTRLNSSHLVISYAVFCLKKKKKKNIEIRKVENILLR